MKFTDSSNGRQREAGAALPGTVFDVWALRSGRREFHEAAIRAKCQTAYLGDHVALCRVLGRYKFFVDTRDVGVATHLMMDGYWEMWNTEMLLREVTPGMTVIDVGAHCGYFSTLLADIVGPAGRLLAFEPNPIMATLLAKTIDVNGFASRTTINEVALSSRAGRAGLLVPMNEPKNAHIVGAGVHPNAIRIDTRRLDSYPEALEADFIKIDAEGAEQAIWEGMSGLLARERPLKILLEFTPGRYRDAGAFLEDILSHGFSLRIVDINDGVVPISVEGVLAGAPLEDQMLLLTRGD